MSGLVLLGPVAVRAQLLTLAKSFDAEYGAEVESKFDLNPKIPERIQAGEVFDLGITNPWYVDALIESGKVDPTTHVPFGRVPLAVGQSSAEGAKLVDSPNQIRALLLDAASIAYTSDGTSGNTFRDVVIRLGISERIGDRLKPMGAGEPVRAAASRRVALAVAPLTTILATQGVTPAAVFPSELQADIDMSMFLSAETAHRTLAQRLLAFLGDSARNAFLAASGVVRFRFPADG